MMPIDLVRLHAGAVNQSKQSIGPVRPKKGEYFLKGPVPLPWLTAAARLPGKSLHTGVALWYASGVVRSRRIALSNVAGGRFGLDRNAKYRALEWLERAGLITVERQLGRAPVVTILEFAEPQ